MLIRLTKNLRRMTKPLLCFWFFCSSMVFCAFSSASPIVDNENNGSKSHLFESQGPEVQPLPRIHLSIDHSATPVSFATSHDVRSHDVHGHHHGMNSEFSGHYSSGNTIHGSLQHDSHQHDSDCCGEVQATSSFGFFFDLPASAFLLILLVFCFRNTGLRIHSNYLKPPPWSPPPIPLLHCSFLN